MQAQSPSVHREVFPVGLRLRLFLPKHMAGKGDSIAGRLPS